MHVTSSTSEQGCSGRDSWSENSLLVVWVLIYRIVLDFSLNYSSHVSADDLW